MSEHKDETCARLGGTGAFACTASGYAACPAERLEAAQRAGQRPALPSATQLRDAQRLVAWSCNFRSILTSEKLCGIGLKPAAQCDLTVGFDMDGYPAAILMKEA
jgi:hypothetical protein